MARFAAVIEEVARKLSGSTVLGADVRSQEDLAMVVRCRLPLSTLKGLSAAGFSEQEIERFVIPHRTRRHRAERNQPLTPDGRRVRPGCAARPYPVIGGTDFCGRRQGELRKELAELGGETPLTVAQTESGARVIERTTLGKIAWGAAA